MDAAITTLVRQSLQAQIRTEGPHTLDYPSQHVSRQSGCAPIIGLRLSLPALVEHPHGQSLRKVFRVQLFGCTALVRIGNEKRHELLRGRVLKVNLQTQLFLWATLQLGIQRADQCGIESTCYEIELGLSADRRARASGY
jgi:hypothetical protein